MKNGSPKVNKSTISTLSKNRTTNKLNLLSQKIQRTCSAKRIDQSEQSANKSFYESYLPEMHQEYRQNYNKKVYQQTFKLYFEFFVYVFSSVMNLLSIVLFIVDNETDQSDNSTFKAIELLFSCYFAFELAAMYRQALNKYKFLTSSATVIDIITVTSSFLTYADNLPLNLNFLRIFKMLKILRMKRIMLLFAQFEKSSEFTEQNSSKIRSLVIKTSITLVLIIFISAGGLTVFHEYLPSSFGEGKFSFITSIYFIICTSTSIGYGDIVPTSIQARFIMVLIIFIIISLISFYTSKIVSLLTSEKPQKHYKFTNHNIILGSLEPNAILKSIRLIYQNVDFDDDQTIVQKTIFIVEENETDVISCIENHEFYHSHLFLVRCDKIDTFSLMRANLTQAEQVFCLNQKRVDNEYVRDFLMYNLYYKIKAEFGGKIKCQFYRFGYYLDRKKQDQNMLDINLMKTFLMSEAAFNTSFVPFISNLVENPVEEEGTDRLKNSYVKTTANKLILVKLNKFCFVPFDGLKKRIYLHCEKVIESDLDSNESQIRLGSSKTLPSGVTGPILMGILTRKNEVMLNPFDYTVQVGDKGIFVYSDEQKLEEILNKIEKEGIKPNFKSEYKTYASNQLNNKFSKEILKSYTLVSKQRKRTAEAFDLPPFLSNHILILGFSASFDLVLTSLKTLTLGSKIVIVNEKFPKNFNFSQFIHKFSHIYLIEQNYLDLKVLLEQANAKSAKKIIILGSNKGDSFECDCKNIAVARLVSEFTKTPYVVELNDNRIAKYLVDSWNENCEIGLLNSKFVGGEVIFKDILNQIAFKKEKEQKILMELIKINQSTTMKWLEERNLDAEVTQLDLFQAKKRLVSLEIGNKHFSSTYGEFVRTVLEDKNSYSVLGVSVELKGKETFLLNPEYDFPLKPSSKVLLLGDALSKGRHSKLTLFRQRRLATWNTDKNLFLRERMRIIKRINAISAILRTRLGELKSPTSFKAKPFNSIRSAIYY